MTRTGPAQAAYGSPAKILVVDDDERNLLALTEVLSSTAQVVTAVSGSDALRRLLREDFAVILLDVFMPGLDGYETAGLIREREQTARIPIIFLSAVNKETEHLVRGYEMGAVDYVFKPVDPLILKSKVGVFVDLYNMRQQIGQQARAEQELREAHYREQLGRIEIERQLEKAERRQASILSSLPIAIYEADGDHATGLRRTFIGDGLEHFLGEQAVSVLNGSSAWEDRIHPDDRSGLIFHAPATGETVATEYRWIGPDGAVRHVLDQRVEIGQPGEGRRWAGTLLDISERKRLEAQLVHAGKLDALGQLTGGVAHDFNNLLAAMLGGIHVLQKRLAMEDREQRVINEMRHAAEQGTELVRRMMAFARQQDLTPTSIDPNGLCESVAGLVSHALGGTVVVNWHCPKSSLNLFVDRGQLELAVMNLIINARDAMPDGGDIAVSIEPSSGLAGHDHAIRVRIADEGVGIPEDIISRVTEPFFTTKETGKGTGLGLSMVAGFAHQSGGSLEIRSAPGKGTQIDLILPATEAPAARPVLIAEGDQSWLAGRTMMLIDDDDSVRIVLAEQLRDLGATIEDFASGADAIAAAQADPERYDFILSDFAMPRLNGLETLRKLQKIVPRARQGMMTGYADDQRLIVADEVRIIRKPIDFAKLAALFEAGTNQPDDDGEEFVPDRLAERRSARG